MNIYSIKCNDFIFRLLENRNVNLLFTNLFFNLLCYCTVATYI